MPFKIVRNDITKVKADVIVNTDNPNPICVSGTDLAIYEAAGKEKLLAERPNIGKIARGDIAVTGAYNLKAKYIIHTVGPVWMDCTMNWIISDLTTIMLKAVRKRCQKQSSHFWNQRILRTQCVMQYHLVEIRIHLEPLQEVLQKHFMESLLC